jgi:trimethylguanosine synthase
MLTDFSQRKLYFSLYDMGCLLDEEGWYSVTPERVADQIAERCRCDTILDAFCGVGGNAIAFAKTCERGARNLGVLLCAIAQIGGGAVIALDTNPTRLALARHNAVLYGVADRIEFVLADYLSFARSYLSLPSTSNRKIDVVFLSPPWGGPSYLSGPNAKIAEAMALVATNEGVLPGDVTPVEVHPEYSLASIQPIHGAKLFELSRRISCNVAYFLPRNTKLEEVSALLGDEQPMDVTVEDRSGRDETAPEVVEVEEEWMGSKLKALTCYFGGLVSGQEHLF